MALAAPSIGNTNNNACKVAHIVREDTVQGDSTMLGNYRVFVRRVPVYLHGGGTCVHC